MLSWESYKWSLEEGSSETESKETADEMLARLKKEMEEAEGEEAMKKMEAHVVAYKAALQADPKTEKVVLYGHEVPRKSVEDLARDSESKIEKIKKGLNTIGEGKGFFGKTLDFIGKHKVATGVGGAVGLAAVGGGGYYLHRRREAARREREEAAREWFYR